VRGEGDSSHDGVVDAAVVNRSPQRDCGRDAAYRASEPYGGSFAQLCVRDLWHGYLTEVALNDRLARDSDDCQKSARCICDGDRVVNHKPVAARAFDYGEDPTRTLRLGFPGCSRGHDRRDVRRLPKDRGRLARDARH